MDLKRAKEILNLAKVIQGDVGALAREPTSPSPCELFDRLVTEAELIGCCRQLFADKHYARSVEEAFKCLNNYIKDRTKCSQDGGSLMKNVFSLNGPKLKLNRMVSASEKDEQLGYMEIYSGCMTGIRNPRAHEHRHKDAPEVALELIVWANHLMRMAKQAKRARRKRSSKP